MNRGLWSPAHPLWSPCEALDRSGTCGRSGGRGLHDRARSQSAEIGRRAGPLRPQGSRCRLVGRAGPPRVRLSGRRLRIRARQGVSALQGLWRDVPRSRVRVHHRLRSRGHALHRCQTEARCRPSSRWRQGRLRPPDGHRCQSIVAGARPIVPDPRDDASPSGPRPCRRRRRHMGARSTGAGADVLAGGWPEGVECSHPW